MNRRTKGTVWVPFKMIRLKIPGLSAWTLDKLGAKMKCDTVTCPGCLRIHFVNKTTGKLLGEKEK